MLRQGQKGSLHAKQAPYLTAHMLLKAPLQGYDSFNRAQSPSSLFLESRQY